ncbi:protein SAR DEFICIENT 1-like isoform X1 [Gastrolobium bilobum]|uniref:protein SAR DEFICIENT 1-like isoform X1 n=1 Tax=Gastrolobium bilobum TaxID=150636 RepID=UPI002AB09B65|nr:protein SAR DEFICIENT 1-like isoform X1 [Gastrolobium bilobum]
MAAKRFFDNSDQDPDKPNDKRMRATRPSFASVIGEVVMAKNLQNLLSGLEPLLRRVVSEEVDRAMRQRCPRSITRSPSMRIQAMEQQSSLQLSFNKRLSLPIFTSSRILDIDGNPINIILVNKSDDGQMVQTSVPYPIKLEIVVLDGDFPPNDNEDYWTSEQFNNHIVKERTGKRPLIAGELNLTMRDGIAPTGDIEFTDNSSWIRSRKFRVAVRVSPGNNQGLRIREAMTEAFTVKDHRGELYKKHHPPMLHDDVWRLEKIGKDGAFHKKLSSEGIKTVQDFLKLAVIDPRRLRKILGIGMSDKMWEVTIKHALTCDMGCKIYIYRGPHFTIFLNPICRLIRADIDGHIFPSRDLSHMNKSYIEKLVREAYARWHTLEEIDAVLNDNIALLTQGDQTVEQYPNNHPASVVTYEQNDYYGDKSVEVSSYVPSNNTQMGCYEWPLNPAYTTASFSNGFPYGFSESQSDDCIKPSGSGSVDID